MPIVDRFIKFINREIAEENEPKETAVLVRVFCLIDFTLLLLSLPKIIADGYATAIAIAIIQLFIFSGIFCLSYRIKMHMLIGIYFQITVIVSLVLTLQYGIKAMFHLQLVYVFLLYFYRSAESTVARVSSVIITGIVYVFCDFYIMSHGVWIELADEQLSSIIISNTMCALAKTAIIGSFFRLKFSASEEKILNYSRKLELLATTDPLTKLQNRRGMINYIEKYAEGSADDGSLLTLAIGDIDFFKKVNDTYGHDAGDYILETLARIMDEFMEGKGMVARWGGEEFLFAFENLNGDYAFEEMSKLLHLIEKYDFTFNNVKLKITMTFGVEEYDNDTGLDKVIAAADEKLYMGKTSGRDRVIY